VSQRGLIIFDLDGTLFEPDGATRPAIVVGDRREDIDAGLENGLVHGHDTRCLTHAPG
jgi:phosphoglycolate phosphatase-like HAD superfamily hydrolase